MIMRDLDRPAACLREMVQAAEVIVPFTGRRHLHGMRHSRFPLVGRDLDQVPADSVRRIPGKPGRAQRILAATLRPSPVPVSRPLQFAAII